MRLLDRFGPAALASLVLATPAAAQVRRFDGNWSVEVVTEQGACDRAYRYAVTIENGRARYGGQGSFDISGQVRPDGRVSGTIARGRDRARVTGRLAGDRGMGTWIASGGRTCSGTWNAERRS